MAQNYELEQDINKNLQKFENEISCLLVSIVLP